MHCEEKDDRYCSKPWSLNIAQRFLSAVDKLKKMRARFDQRKELKREYELFIKFEEECYHLWGLYQQTVVGNINVPKLNYMDPEELSWMWSWIKGNKKWHAWNQCIGMSRDEASDGYIEGVDDLERRLPDLIEKWKDEQDPMVPDPDAWVPEEDREEWAKRMEEGKRIRREKSSAQRKHEESLGMWDE